jgi:hypothetical protein
MSATTAEKTTATAVRVVATWAGSLAMAAVVVLVVACLACRATVGLNTRAMVVRAVHASRGGGGEDETRRRLEGMLSAVRRSGVPFYRDVRSWADVPVVTKPLIKMRERDFMSPRSYSRRMLGTCATASNAWTDKQTPSRDRMGAGESLRVLVGLCMGRSMAQITGGTSGQYFYQWYDKGDLWRGCYTFVRSWVAMGWRPRSDDTMLLYYMHGSNSVKMMGKSSMLLGRRFVALSPEIDEATGDLLNAPELLETLGRHRPRVLVTFPNLFFRVCQLLHRSRSPAPHQPDFIDLSADLLFNCQYGFIKRFFPRSVVRCTYGTVEFGQIAVQKDEADTMTYVVHPDIAHVEQLDSRSNLVVTSLIMRTKPLMRYQIDDRCDRVTLDAAGRQVLEGLVGKDPTGGRFDLVALDRRIQEWNRRVSTDDDTVINARVCPRRGSLTVWCTGGSPIDPTRRLSLGRALGYERVEVVLCDEVCPTLDVYSKKVSPFASSFSSVKSQI